MSAYVIGYDIHPTKGETYDELIEAIKTNFPTYWHHLDSTWVVATEHSAKEIRDTLRPYMREGDELLVVGSSKEGAWFGFNKAGGDWLLKHL